MRTLAICGLWLYADFGYVRTLAFHRVPPVGSQSTHIASPQETRVFASSTDCCELLQNVACCYRGGGRLYAYFGISWHRRASACGHPGAAHPARVPRPPRTSASPLRGGYVRTLAISQGRPGNSQSTYIASPQRVGFRGISFFPAFENRKQYNSARAPSRPHSTLGLAKVRPKYAKVRQSTHMASPRAEP